MMILKPLSILRPFKTQRLPEPVKAAPPIDVVAPSLPAKPLVRMPYSGALVPPTKGKGRADVAPKNKQEYLQRWANMSPEQRVWCLWNLHDVKGAKDPATRYLLGANFPATNNHDGLSPKG